MIKEIDAPMWGSIMIRFTHVWKKKTFWNRWNWHYNQEKSNIFMHVQITGGHRDKECFHGRKLWIF